MKKVAYTVDIMVCCWSPCSSTGSVWGSLSCQTALGQQKQTVYNK